MNKTLDIKVVVFDCDGVMFDTLETNIMFYNTILQQFKRSPMTKEQSHFIHMQTVDKSLEFLFSDLDNLNEIYAFKNSMDYCSFLPYMKIEPELKSVLNKLRPKYKTAIATNRTDTMKPVLIEFELSALFDMVVTTMDVINPKPAPDPILKIIENFNITHTQLIFIGDTIIDQLSAKAAQVAFVAYKDKSLQADYHIDSLKEICNILNL